MKQKVGVLCTSIFLGTSIYLFLVSIIRWIVNREIEKEKEREKEDNSFCHDGYEAFSESDDDEFIDPDIEKEFGTT